MNAAQTEVLPAPPDADGLLDRLEKLAALGLLDQRKRGRAFVFLAWPDLAERLRES